MLHFPSAIAPRSLPKGGAPESASILPAGDTVIQGSIRQPYCRNFMGVVSLSHLEDSSLPDPLCSSAVSPKPWVQESCHSHVTWAVYPWTFVSEVDEYTARQSLALVLVPEIYLFVLTLL